MVQHEASFGFAQKPRMVDVVSLGMVDALLNMIGLEVRNLRRPF